MYTKKMENTQRTFYKYMKKYKHQKVVSMKKKERRHDISISWKNKNDTENYML